MTSLAILYRNNEIHGTEDIANRNMVGYRESTPVVTKVALAAMESLIPWKHTNNIVDFNDQMSVNEEKPQKMKLKDMETFFRSKFKGKVMPIETIFNNEVTDSGQAIRHSRKCHPSQQSHKIEEKEYVGNGVISLCCVIFNREDVKMLGDKK
ncbi:hypothetical protein BDQ17DRAFT_1329446 [Cyathus striatus]|nr:hypothetical protein BDQ17DRAFT_1329446 [Cyathus striatus]